MPAQFCILIIASLLASRAGAQEPPGKFDPNDIHGYVTRLNRSNHPEAVRIREELANGPRLLEEQRKLARAEGLPLTPGELKRPTIPASKNAAPLYLQLSRLLKQKPLNPWGRPRRSFIEYPMGPRTVYLPSDIRDARRHLAQRRDVMDLIHRATDRPECDFKRDWSLGMAVPFPEFAMMRSAARLLVSESYLLAKAGKYQEAVNTLSRGFRIANHTASEPFLIGHLVAIAVNAITLRGMEYILEMAPNRADVARMVRAAVEENRPRLDPRKAIEGEVAIFQSWGMAEIRKNPGALQTMLSDAGDDEPRKLGPEETRFVLKLADVAEAKQLAYMRRLLKAARMPGQEQRRAVEKLSAESAALENSGDPADVLVSFLLPVFAQAFASYTRSHAQQEVTLAAAAVMEYRARNRRFPQSLAQAIKTPADPFTGRTLGYRREPQGFVVFSAGPDGKFTGGEPGMKRETGAVVYRYPPPPPKAPDAR